MHLTCYALSISHALVMHLAFPMHLAGAFVQVLRQLHTAAKYVMRQLCPEVLDTEVCGTGCTYAFHAGTNQLQATEQTFCVPSHCQRLKT